MMAQSKQESSNKNRILTELMNAQQRGLLNGICGRLGDLGIIDERFDCAITTACSFLDHFVVETI
jgi:structural maintenance of chromosome 4